MKAPSYTTCVDRKNFDGVGFDAEFFASEIGVALFFFITMGIPGLFATPLAAMAALHKVCEFLLHGKLVCLADKRCAWGRVVSFETVDDKKGFNKIDNDFAFNLLLMPYDLRFFTQGDFAADGEEGVFQKLYEAVTKGKQGDLIQEQPDMPVPVEAKDGRKYWPTRYRYGDRTNPSFNSSSDGKAGFWVPLFHCEIEGERIHSVCYALDLPLNIVGLGKICRCKPLGIPIGRWICAAVSLAFAPIVLISLGVAWLAGSDDNREFEKAGDLQAGDEIFVSGRWVFDGAHEGWNELHPVLSIQRTSILPPVRPISDQFDEWCNNIEHVPPGPVLAGTTRQGLTAKQQQVYDQQRRPENRWRLHPLVDGCLARARDNR